MIDLTPLDIRKKKRDFTRGLRGYDTDEVDHFLDLIAERLEEVVKLNLTLRERVDRLAERVQGQEERERAVQEALVTAQSLKHDIQERAELEASQVREEAAESAGQVKREAESTAKKTRRTAEAAAELALREAEAAADRVRREAEEAAQRLQREAEGASERVREQIDGIIDARKTEIVELNLARSRFMKGFRGLLERELGQLERMESDSPADELDLDVLQFGRGAALEGTEEGALAADVDIDSSAEVRGEVVLDDVDPPVSLDTEDQSTVAEAESDDESETESPSDVAAAPRGGANGDGRQTGVAAKANEGPPKPETPEPDLDRPDADSGPEVWGPSPG